MSRFGLTQTPIAGVTVVERQRRGDDRGFLARVFCAEELAEAGWTWPIAQLNESFTARRGAIRGMHFQGAPHGEAKLVSCLAGSIYDVALDLRRGSPTFLQHHAEVLSAENGRAMLLPPGVAHGFQSLTDDALLLYAHSAAYAPESEGGVNPFDPRAGLHWPLPPGDLSIRDRDRPMLDAEFDGVEA